jgi:PAS domain S-box-containing protein
LNMRLPFQGINPSRRLIINLWIGFAATMLLLLGVISLGVHRMKEINLRLERIVNVYNVKSYLASNMRETLRDRAIVMHDIVVSIDIWEKEDLFEKFLNLGEKYSKDRSRLSNLLENDEEKKLMRKLDEITRINQPIMYEVVNDALDDNNYDALTLLQQKAIPQQKQLVAALDDMSSLQRRATDSAAREAVTDYQQTRSALVFMGTLAALLAFMVAILISRRAASQTRLLDSEKLKYQTLFETNSDAVVILDDKGFTDCNPATLRMFGMESVAEFLATSITSLGAPLQGPNQEYAAKYAGRMINLARKEGHAFMEWLGRRTDGSLFPAEIALHAMELDGRPVIQAIMRDITDRKEAERAMAEARDAALSASRTKSAFVANVSHEIRTPLHGILGMTDLLLKTGLQTGEQRDYALTLKRSANGLLTVINDLLDFSKIEAGKLELEEVPFDLRSLLEEIINLYRARALEKGLTLEASGFDGLKCCMMGDPHRLRQILLNLVDNAFKFTQQGGIRIEVTKRASDIYHIRIADTGIGISKDSMTRLFEAFSQADSSTTRRFGGTGLGLAISHELAVLMKGSIEVESPCAGQTSGSCFTLIVPLKSLASKLTPPKEALPHRFAGRALIVEDNPVNQKVLHYQLKALGLDADVAKSGSTALAMLRADPDRDIIFMDWQMPDMDGFAVTREIRSAIPAASRIPIIALTANVTPGFREACLHAGMDDYLSKPYEESALILILNTWLTKKIEVFRDEPESPGQPAADIPIELGQLEKRLGGDKTVLADMLDVFVDSTERLLLDIHESLRDSNLEAAAKQCHSLRGAASAVLARPLMKLVNQLEEAIRRKDEDAVGVLLDDIEAEFIRIRNYIHASTPTESC